MRHRWSVHAFTGDQHVAVRQEGNALGLRQLLLRNERQRLEPAIAADDEQGVVYRRQDVEVLGERMGGDGGEAQLQVRAGLAPRFAFHGQRDTGSAGVFNHFR